MEEEEWGEGSALPSLQRSKAKRDDIDRSGALPLDVAPSDPAFLAAKAALLEDLAAFRRRWAAMPLLDNRSDEEILGYDENGLPS